MICMLCEGQLGQTLLEITEPDRFEKHCGVGTQNYFRQWKECVSCGAANNILPASSQELLQKLRSSYYEVDLPDGDVGAKYRKVMGLPPEQSDNWHRVQRINSFLTRWLGTSRGTSHQILDIGAGTGVFLSRLLELSEQSWQATAVEPDPVAAKHLRELGGFAVREEMFTGQSDLKNFTLVTLNKVLEHIEDPTAVLGAVVNSLAANGLVYVEVPDKLTTRLRRYNDNILGALHYHLYHPRSLAWLFEWVGLEPLLIERVFEPSGKITVFGFACLPGWLDKR